MRKIPITLLIALSSALFTNGAAAQNQPLACQVEKNAGLAWENGQWITKTFIPFTSKFILVQAGNTLTMDSVAKVLRTTSDVSCRYPGNSIECTDRSGGALFFEPKTLKGGVAQLLGSTEEGNQRDTVTVQVFSCTRF
jgi:hypothetical protein